MQVEAGLQEVKMNYIFPGLMITLMLTIFMSAIRKSDLLIVLRERTAKGKSGRRD